MTSRANTNKRVGRQTATNMKADRKYPQAKQASSVPWLLRAAKATILSPRCKAGLLSQAREHAWMSLPCLNTVMAVHCLQGSHTWPRDAFINSTVCRLMLSGNA